MNRLLVLAVLAVLTLAGKAKDAILYVPAHCVRVDEFLKTCKAAKYGGFDCPHVRISIKPLPECAEFDHRNILRIGSA